MKKCDDSYASEERQVLLFKEPLSLGRGSADVPLSGWTSAGAANNAARSLPVTFFFLSGLPPNCRMTLVGHCLGRGFFRVNFHQILMMSSCGRAGCSRRRGKFDRVDLSLSFSFSGFLFFYWLFIRKFVRINNQIPSYEIYTTAGT